MTRKLILFVMIMTSVIVAGSMTAQASDKKTVYVSSVGSADNSGESSSEPITLDAAYAVIESVDTIIVMDDITYSDPPAHSGVLTIKGNTNGIIMTMANNMSLKGDLTVSNLTISNKNGYDIYANGYSLTMAEDVTSDEYFTVFGGTSAAAYTGDTNITLLGGKYDLVFGGSNNAEVVGNSNIVFGGNANSGDTIKSGCRIYGGGNNSNVTGATNVILTGNAVCQYMFGGNRMTSSTPGTPENININITGGNAMNVYGGTENYELDGCDIDIEINGGTVEAIFGGSVGANLNGNVNIDLAGGEITRRVYTGCYNEASIFMSYSTDYHVVGTTTLRILPTMSTSKLISGSDTNRGVFAGSRYDSAFSDEINTIIFLDGCYSTHQDEITQSSYSFDSKEDYIVSATTGGDVQGTDIGGTVYLSPQVGKYATINGSGEYENVEAKLTNSGTAVNNVAFVDYNFKIHGVTASAKTSGVTAKVTLTANNNGGTVYSNPMAVVAVFDESGRFVGVTTNRSISGTAVTYTFDIPCDLERENEYTVKAMLLNIGNNDLISLADNITEKTIVPEATTLKQIKSEIVAEYTATITAQELEAFQQSN